MAIVAFVSTIEESIIAVSLLSIRIYKAVQPYLPIERFKQYLYERFSSLPFCSCSVCLFSKLICILLIPQGVVLQPELQVLKALMIKVCFGVILHIFLACIKIVNKTHYFG